MEKFIAGLFFFLFIIGIVAIVGLILSGIVKWVMRWSKALPTKAAKKESEEKKIEDTPYTLMRNLTDPEKIIFMADYNSVKKNHTTAIVLAIFLGGAGAHHFYLGSIWLGILYLIFIWTLIPSAIALLECFFMKERIANLNKTKAELIHAKIKTITQSSQPESTIDSRQETTTG